MTSPTDLPLTPKSRFDGTNLVLTDSTPATLDVLQAELVELRSYCSFYARLYNELNLDMLQVKHILKRTTSATGDPPKAFDDYIPGKFTNTANGLSLHKQQDTSPKVQELLEQIKKLEIENNELKLKLSFAESANGMGSKNSSRGSSLGSENAFVVNGEEKSKVC